MFNVFWVLAVYVPKVSVNQVS